MNGSFDFFIYSSFFLASRSIIGLSGGRRTCWTASLALEETTKEEGSARVQVLKQLVMESGTLHTACSHLQPPQPSHSPAVTTAGLLSHL